MAIHALEGLAPQWYTPKGQPEGDEAAQFELCPLNGEQFTSLFCLMEDTGRRFTGEAVSYALRHGLTGECKNFHGRNGALKATPDNQALIPFGVRMDLASQIYDISILSGTQKKT